MEAVIHNYLRRENDMDKWNDHLMEVVTVLALGAQAYHPPCAVCLGFHRSRFMYFWKRFFPRAPFNLSLGILMFQETWACSLSSSLREKSVKWWMLSSDEVERKLCTGISVTFAIWVHLTLLLLYLECFLIVRSRFPVSSGGCEGLCPSPSAAHFSFGAHNIQSGFPSIIRTEERLI